jgi:translation initiation factor 2 alpha subunit (eIF-2alpha)
MAERKPEWPEAGDIEPATIETLTDYGAYAKLDEYNRGLLRVSEISSAKNIRKLISNVTESGGQGTFRREK